MPSPPDILNFPRPLIAVEVTEEAIPAGVEKRFLQRLREGFESGRAEGERGLNTQLIQQRTEVIELQNGVLGSISAVLPELIKECEKNLVDLAVEVAGKLVAGLPVDQTVIEATVMDALSRMEHACSYTVVLNPADLELLQRMRAGILTGHPDGGAHQISFRSSPDVSKGGCLLESPFGVIDARRETRMAQVRKALLN